MIDKNFLCEGLPPLWFPLERSVNQLHSFIFVGFNRLVYIANCLNFNIRFLCFVMSFFAQAMVPITLGFNGTPLSARPLID